MEMNIQDVKNYLPHRYPFLLIDKVLNIEVGKSIVAIKNVTFNEPQFTGHFLWAIFWLIITPGFWLGSGGLLGWVCHLLSSLQAHRQAK